MNLTGYRRQKRIRQETGKLQITIPNILANRLRAIHATAILGESHSTALETLILEILDNFIVDHRSNKPPAVPERHQARRGDDEAFIYHV